MPVARLTLTDFRSYAEATITLGPGFVVLTGENGAGKTNVLEAVSMLAPGRGLRRATLAEMARQDGPGSFAIAARLAGEGEPVDIGTGTTAAVPDRRKVRINGADAAAADLSDWLTVLWLTPAMDRLFTGPPGDRRRFLDRLTLALAPGHGRHAARYEAALRARNRLLSDPAPLDEDWCAALEAQLGEHGAALIEARAATVTALNEALAGEADEPFAKPLLAVESVDTDSDLGVTLAENRSRDRHAGRTLIGPHRDDLSVTHAAKDQPAANCSTGEQKAMLLALVLAHADLVAEKIGRRPVLLLDEVAAHLDPVRRGALFARLAAAGGQVWMTGTEPELFTGLSGDAAHFRVAPGRIAPI